MSLRGSWQKRLVLRTPLRTSDGQGKYVTSGYTEVAKVWGSVVPIKVGRRAYLGQNSIDVTHQLETERFAVPAQTQVVEDHGDGTNTFYTVQTIEDVSGRQRWMRLMLKEIPNPPAEFVDGSQ